MRPRGIVAAVAVLALTVSACAEADDLADDVRDTASEIADDVQDATDTTAGGDSGTTTQDQDDGQGSAATGGSDGSNTDGGASDDGSTGDGDGGRQQVPADDLGPVGANGKPMLQGSWSRLVLEIDVQSCTSVDQAAVDHLVATLRSVVDKPGGVELRGGNTFESDLRQWTTRDLRDNAARNRETSSGGDEVSVYVQYVCGSFHRDGEETAALGVAHNASEVGIFPQRWNDGIGVLLGSNRAVERAVLVHEAGHLFGLVNLTYRSDVDHEDPEHPGHSSNQGSVMYWAIESTAIGQVFSGPPPDSFDDADRADLEGLKSGRY